MKKTASPLKHERELRDGSQGERIQHGSASGRTTIRTLTAVREASSRPRSRIGRCPDWPGAQQTGDRARNLLRRDRQLRAARGVVQARPECHCELGLSPGGTFKSSVRAFGAIRSSCHSASPGASCRIGCGFATCSGVFPVACRRLRGRASSERASERATRTQRGIRVPASERVRGLGDEVPGYNKLAGDGNRTRLAGLGSQNITTMLRPPTQDPYHTQFAFRLPHAQILHGLAPFV